jgi:hypothetical protein
MRGGIGGSAVLDLTRGRRRMTNRGGAGRMPAKGSLRFQSRLAAGEHGSSSVACQLSTVVYLSTTSGASCLEKGLAVFCLLTRFSSCLKRARRYLDLERRRK